MLAERRHIITAMGLANALGDNVESVWTALLEGRPRTSAPPFELPFETVCGAVQGPLNPLSPGEREFDSRLARIALRVLPQVTPSVARARQRYGADRVALLVGTSTGGLDATEPAYRHFRKTQERAPDFSLRNAHAFDALNVLLARVLGLTGPSYSVSTACTSSVKAIASALRLLEADVCDAALVVGADALCETTLRGFHSLGVLSTQPARPFSAERDGIHIGEGAAMLLIERRGEGPAYVASVGETSDAHSMSAPHPEGRGAAEAIRAALAKARLAPEQIDYVNAHGTGTEQNDHAESQAIRSTLGGHVPVSSTKGLTGHTLGACGAMEAIFSALAIQHGQLPPSAGALPVDPALGINVVRAPTRMQVKAVLSNAFAFGGSNTGLIPGGYMNDTLYVEGFGAITQYPKLSDFPLGARAELPKPDLGLLERTLRRGLSDVTRMFMHVAQSALADAGVQAQDVHIVFGSAFGELSTAEALMAQAFSDDTSSPARFRHSVHNSAPGLLSISSHNLLASTAIAAGWNTVAMGLLEARALLNSGESRVLLVFAEEAVPHALSADHDYGPAAVALVLSQTLSSLPPRASLSGLARVHGEPRVRDPFAGENHPLGPAILLAEALEAGRSETLQVGSGPAPWCVELRSVRAKARHETLEPSEVER